MAVAAADACHCCRRRRRSCRRFTVLSNEANLIVIANFHHAIFYCSTDHLTNDIFTVNIARSVKANLGAN